MIAFAKQVFVIAVVLLSFLCMVSCSAQDMTPVENQDNEKTSQVTYTAIANPSLTPIPKLTQEPSLVSTEQPPPTPPPSPSATDEIQGGRQVTENLVLQLKEDKPERTFYISPDGSRFAYTVAEGEMIYMVLDGDEGERYDEISEATFSPDSQHLAYIARVGETEFVVYDGTALPAYDEIITPNGSSNSDALHFSPDSQRIAYRAYLGNAPRLIIDGEEYTYAGIGFEIAFSPDSQHVAFIAGNLNDEWFVVIDGVESQKYDAIMYDSMVYSPDSQHFAFQGKRGGAWFVVVDGQGSDPWDISPIGFNFIFSPDSQHFAYIVENNDGWFIVLDGVELKTYESANEPVFSPDSQHFAYKANQGDEWFVVLDNIEGKSYDGWPVSISFSPDSQKLAYIVETDDQEFLVLDGEEYEPYQQTKNLTFSPDGQRIAYKVYDGEMWYMIVDDEKTKGYPSISNFFFSPDSKHTVFLSDFEDGQRSGDAVIVDGVPGKVYDMITWRMVLHGMDKYRLFFDTEGNLIYYALLDNGVYLIKDSLD